MRWGRIILGVIVAEVAAVLLLVVLVFLTGPSDPDGATRYAEEIGRWVGYRWWIRDARGWVNEV